MLTHISCTAGLERNKIPLELTNNGILALSFHELDTIKDEMFALQVINIKYSSDLLQDLFASNLNALDKIEIKYDNQT